MTYEKLGQKKKAQKHLENCRYFTLCLATATLDSTQKQCSEGLTDGEELKNSQRIPRQIHSIVALFLRVIKGTARSRASGGWIIASGS